MERRKEEKKKRWKDGKDGKMGASFLKYKKILLLENRQKNKNYKYKESVALGKKKKDIIDRRRRILFFLHILLIINCYYVIFSIQNSMLFLC